MNQVRATPMRRPQLFLLVLVAMLGTTTSLTLVASPQAHAASTTLCSTMGGCQSAGRSTYGWENNLWTSHWGQSAGHNCTNYVAYRLKTTNGIGAKPWSQKGNANTWGTYNASITNSTPARGSVAWWDANAGKGPAGHVAYVEEVNSDGSIIISEDSWDLASDSGNVDHFAYKRLTPGSGWPTGFIHFKDLSGGPIADGSLVNYGGNVYRVAGGAPLYVSSWTHIGGEQPSRALTNQEFSALRTYPRDGTLISGHAPGSPDHGSVYVVARGAPIYVSNYANIGGDRGTVGVDLAAIHNADGGGVWNHLRQKPVDGTLISGQAPGSPDHGSVYVVAGGAPIYVSNYANIGGDRGTVGVDLAAIHNADGGGVWNHLRQKPVDGTLISGQAPGSPDHGSVYVVAGGAPIYVSNYANIGGDRGTVGVDLAAIHNADGGGVWNHLRQKPVDGTLISGQAPGSPDHGSVYVVAGGAPIYVSNYANIGGDRGTVGVDLAAIHNADGGGVWNHLRYRPSDGTILVAGSQKYRTAGGAPVAVTTDASGVTVDPAAIANAGQPGVWSHLLAASLQSTAAPTVTGTPRVGVKLTASPGTWSPPASYAYQWLADGVAISGATASTYTPTATQKGKRISVAVTATKTGYISANATSAQTAVVAAGIITNSTLPTIAGTKRVGYTLTANVGTWSPGGLTYRYQWFRGTTAISGATARTYKLPAAMSRQKIRVRVTAIRPGYTSLAKYSAYTAAIQ